MQSVTGNTQNYYEDDVVADHYRFRPPYLPEFFKQLAQELDLKRTDVPLDLLCGRGEIASRLLEHCENIVATDGSREMLNRAIQSDRIEYIQGDVNDPGFTGLFDNRKFEYCFIGRAIIWVNEDSLLRIRDSLLADRAWFLVLRGKLANDNPWIQNYREVIQFYGGGAIGVDLVGKEKILGAGFEYQKALVGNFMADIGIDYLYGLALSYTPERTHQLRSEEQKVKAALESTLSQYYQDDRKLNAHFTNSAIIYRSASP